MADSDSDYIASSGDEAGGGGGGGGGPARRGGDRAGGGGGRGAGKGGGKRAAKPRERERWEEVQRAWDVGLDDDVSIESTVAELLEAGKKRRLLKDETALQRGIIRHVVLVLDLSSAMAEKDLRPTRYLLTLRYAADFVREFFEQNPLAQLAVVGMRDGLALRVSDLSGNPAHHVEQIERLRLDEPAGAPSLQNALEMARAALFHAPAHGTREAVVVLGALWSADPGDIHATIGALVADRIRVAVVGLAAQVAVCRELVARTNAGSGGGGGGGGGSYHVALNEAHFREKLLEATTPPVTRTQSAATNGLLMMGFPSRTVAGPRAQAPQAALCACHSTPVAKDGGGYLCSRCATRVCVLPCTCPACGLTLILSTHLARSYHHLFPLRNWLPVSWAAAASSTHCFGCLRSFPPPPLLSPPSVPKDAASNTSVSSRYSCPACKQHFCVDCDVFCHETLYNCPGCLSLPSADKGSAGDVGRAGVGSNGLGAGDAMATD